MAHHVTSHDIPENGEHLEQSKIGKVKTIALAVMVLGGLLSAYFLFFALFYFFTLALGGCFWTLLHMSPTAAGAPVCAA
jgi:hypothetical protein